MAQQQTQKQNTIERKGQGVGVNPEQGQQTKQQGMQDRGSQSTRQAQGGTDLDEEREESMDPAEGERDVQDSTRQ